MRMKLTAATALAGSLLLVPLMQGSAQSASVTGLGKSLTSTAGTLTLVHGGGGGGAGGGGGGGGGHGGGGGGGFAAAGGGGGHAGGGGGHGGGGAGHGGGWGGGHVGGGWGGGHMRGGWGGDHMAGRVGGWGGPRMSHFEHEGHLDHGHFDHGHFDHGHHFAMEREHDHLHHRFVRNRFFFAGGGWPYYYDYGYDCGRLHRQAVITGSPYWWHRYQLCVGYY